MESRAGRSHLALRGMGFRAILAPSFGNIFVTNCYFNGVLPVVLPRERIVAIVAWNADRATPDRMLVDLDTRTATGPDGLKDTFGIPALRRQALLEGLDDIALTLTRQSDIRLFQRDNARRRPWVYAM